MKKTHRLTLISKMKNLSSLTIWVISSASILRVPKNVNRNESARARKTLRSSRSKWRSQPNYPHQCRIRLRRNCSRQRSVRSLPSKRREIRSKTRLVTHMWMTMESKTFTVTIPLNRVLRRRLLSRRLREPRVAATRTTKTKMTCWMTTI